MAPSYGELSNGDLSETRVTLTTEAREWTKFEMRVVLSLLCRHVDPRDTIGFATELNKALNGKSYKDDIPVDDVRAMLDKLSREKKGVLAFIERQPTQTITRLQSRIFQKRMVADGSLREWVLEGRRDRLRNGEKDRPFQPGDEVPWGEVDWDSYPEGTQEKLVRELRSTGNRAYLGLLHLGLNHANATLASPSTPQSPVPDPQPEVGARQSVTPLRQGGDWLRSSRVRQGSTATAPGVSGHYHGMHNTAPAGMVPQPSPPPSQTQHPASPRAGYSHLDPDTYKGPVPAPRHSESGLTGGFAAYAEPLDKSVPPRQRGTSEEYPYHRRPDSSGTARQ